MKPDVRGDRRCACARTVRTGSTTAWSAARRTGPHWSSFGTVTRAWWSSARSSSACRPWKRPAAGTPSSSASGRADGAESTGPTSTRPAARWRSRCCVGTWPRMSPPAVVSTGRPRPSAASSTPTPLRSSTSGKLRTGSCSSPWSISRAPVSTRPFGGMGRWLRCGRPASPARWPCRSPRPMPRGSSTATSSRTTSCWLPTKTGRSSSRCSISVWPRSWGPTRA